MSNKFNVGDRVRRIGGANSLDGATIYPGDVLTVAGHETGGLLFNIPGTRMRNTWSDPAMFELVEPAPTMAPDVPPSALQPSGHHPDGSSIQQHSAGGLYPCVLVWRDKKVHDGQGKYDVGVIIPGHEPIWCQHLDAAVALGEAWLKGRAA